MPLFGDDPPPQLRVQIWYNSSVGGISDKVNRELVESLPTTMREPNDMDWIIKPREYSDGTPDGMSRRFVPIEVGNTTPPYPSRVLS